MKLSDSKLYLCLEIALFLVVPLGFGIITYFFGKPFNWDLLNYHYYNPYAFLNSRLDFDIAPAQLQTYHNPLPDIPFYWLSSQLPAWVSVFAYATVQGINLPLLFLLCWRLIVIQSLTTRFLYALGVSVFACIGPAFILEIGTTFHDNIVSLLVLLGLLLIVEGGGQINLQRKKRGIISIISAGIVLGALVGLKQTAVIYAFGATVALPFAIGTWRWRLLALGLFALAGLTGGLLTNGYWMWILWHHYQNPFFPYLNQFFDPSLGPGTRGFTGFIPDELWEYLLWPFLFSINALRVNEHLFFDIRFGILYAVFLIYIASKLWRVSLNRYHRLRQIDFPIIFERKAGNMLLVFFVVSFVVWIPLFSIYRYLLTLELLTPVVFLILLDRIGLRQKELGMVTMLVVFGMLSVFKPLDPRGLEWTHDYFEVETEQFTDLARALVVMLGNSPMAYIIPEFPREVQFIRPEGNLQLEQRPSMYQRMLKIIQRQEGPIYIMFGGADTENLVTRVRTLGLDYDRTKCFNLEKNTPQWIRACRVSRRNRSDSPKAGTGQ